MQLLLDKLTVKFKQSGGYQTIFKDLKNPWFKQLSGRVGLGTNQAKVFFDSFWIKAHTDFPQPPKLKVDSVSDEDSNNSTSSSSYSSSFSSSTTRISNKQIETFRF